MVFRQKKKLRWFGHIQYRALHSLVRKYDKLVVIPISGLMSEKGKRET